MQVTAETRRRITSAVLLCRQSGSIRADLMCFILNGYNRKQQKSEPKTVCFGFFPFLFPAICDLMTSLRLGDLKPDRLVVSVGVGLGDLRGDESLSVMAAPFERTVDPGDDGTQDAAFHFRIGAEPFHGIIGFCGEIEFFGTVLCPVNAAGINFPVHAAPGNVRFPCFGILDGKGDLDPSAEVFVFDIRDFYGRNAGDNNGFTIQPRV